LLKVRAAIYLMRPHQWYKNLLFFLGPIFALKITTMDLWPRLLIGFLVLCLCSSSNYVFNDLLDMERDKFHPRKKNRPLSSGAISPMWAVAIFIIGGIVSLWVAFELGFGFFLMVLALFATSQVYSLALGRIAFLDILTVSADHVWRALSGCYLVSVRVSPWLIVCVFLLALLLALGKRRIELESLSEKAVSHRDVFRTYSQKLLDQLISVVATSLLLSYSLYCFMSGTGGGLLILTLPVATYIIFRYMYLIMQSKLLVEDPYELIKDKQLLAAGIVWIIMIAMVLYLGTTYLDLLDSIVGISTLILFAL